MVIVTPKGTSVGHSESFECLCVKIGPWVWPGRVLEKRKKKKKKTRKKEKKSHKEHILPKFNKPWGRHRLFDRDQIWQVGWALITHANFKHDRLRTGCVALHESL